MDNERFTRFGAEVLHRGENVVFGYAEKELSPLPYDQFLEEWRQAHDTSTLEARQRCINDLHLNRVGVVRTALQDKSFWVTCAPVNWFSIEVLRDPVKRTKIPEEYRFSTLAVTVLLQTADSKFILSKRCENVATYQNHWTASAAGYVEWDSFSHQRSPFGQIIKEIYEELNLRRDDISDPKLVCLCRYPVPENLLIEASYTVLTKLSAADVLNRAAHAKDKWEGKCFAFSREEILYLLDRAPFHPAGAATILLAFEKT